MATRKTNVEFITHLMQFEGSALMQCFVVEALDYYAKHVIAQQSQVQDPQKLGFVSPDAWNDCAKRAQRAIAKQYS